MKECSIIPLHRLQSTDEPLSIQTITGLSTEQREGNAIPHQHDHYELVWIIKGRGMLQMDLLDCPLEDDMFYCLRPGQAHRFRLEPGTEGIIFSFTVSFFNPGELESECAYQASLNQLFHGRQAINIRSELAADMMEIVRKMRSELDNVYSYRLQILTRYFRIFLIYLNRHLAEEDMASALQTKERWLVNNFMQLLDKSFRQRKMVADYALQLAVTPNYLNRIVKKQTGYPAGHYIRQRVVLEAKRMGRYTSASMKEIAYDLGFLDCAHFSKFFKTVSGTNFSEFKKGA